VYWLLLWAIVGVVVFLDLFAGGVCYVYGLLRSKRLFVSCMWFGVYLACLVLVVWLLESGVVGGIWLRFGCTVWPGGVGIWGLGIGVWDWGWNLGSGRVIF